MGDELTTTQAPTPIAIRLQHHRGPTVLQVVAVVEALQVANQKPELRAIAIGMEQLIQAFAGDTDFPVGVVHRGRSAVSARSA